MDADRLVECVPNISEGRRPKVIDQVAAAFTEAAPGVLLLDRSSDPDHDRTVLTLAGPGPALVEAAVAGARASARLVDLTRHTGAHPRLGALDVLPFVPLGRATRLGGPAGEDGMAGAGGPAGEPADPEVDCAALARRAGQRIAAEVGVPVYLYGAAAARPERAGLPAVRWRGFEALLAAAPADPARAPDLGGPALHQTAGAVAVGARPVLVAYNVDLAGADLDLARRIAGAVRERDGGLPAVRAMGVRLATRGLVQVSMNLLDYRVTPPAAAFAAVAGLAARAGARVVRSQIVGLVPAAALAGTDPADLALHGFTGDQVLERRLARVLDREGFGEPPEGSGEPQGGAPVNQRVPR
jgi:glutamate formiminotransferase